MGLAGRALAAETLGWDRIADRFIELYRSLADRPAAASGRAAA
jgi:hypothetical protein